MTRKRTFHAGTARERARGGQRAQNPEKQATRAIKGQFRGSKSKTAKANAALAKAKARRVKEKLIGKVLAALAKAPRLEIILKRHCDKVVIRTPRGRWRVYNYREGLESVLAKVKRLKV